MSGLSLLDAETQCAAAEARARALALPFLETAGASERDLILAETATVILAVAEKRATSISVTEAQDLFRSGIDDLLDIERSVDGSAAAMADAVTELDRVDERFRTHLAIGAREAWDEAILSLSDLGQPVKVRAARPRRPKRQG